MNIRVLPAAQLSADDWAAWSKLQRSQPALSNPFFRPEFTQAVAAERDNVEVAVWEQFGQPVGFLPFERTSKGRGKPVGSHINECQGAIVRPGVDWSPQEVLAAARLRSWQFDHVPVSQTALAPFQHVVSASPYLDLSPGPGRAGDLAGSAPSKTIAEVERRRRKAARELGEVRLETQPAGGAALGKLLNWKIDQCRRTGMPCNYGLAWVVRLFERLLGQQAPEFAGTMFSLYFGDRLAAAFSGVRAGNRVSGLVFGYEREFEKFSPGSQLLLQMMKAAPQSGIARIDLGKGGEHYKSGFATAQEYVTEGAVCWRRLPTSVYRRLFWAKDRLRSSPLRTPVRRVRRWMLSTRIWLGSQE